MSDSAQAQTQSPTPPRPVATVLSEVVTDLARIFPQITGADVATGLPTGGGAREQRAAYGSAFRKEYATNPPNTPKPRATRLDFLRNRFAGALSIGGPPEDGIAAVKKAFEALVAEHDDAKRTEVKRVELLDALEAALPQTLIDQNSNDLGHDDARPLRDERTRIATVLDDPSRALNPVTNETVPIATLGGQVTTFVDGVIKRENTRARLRADLAAAIKPTATTPDDVVPGADTTDVSALLVERQRIADVIERARTLQPLTDEVSKVQAVATAVASLGDKVEQRAQSKARIETTAAQAKASLPSEVDQTCLDDDLGKIDDNLKVPPALTDARISEADRLLDQVQKHATNERELFLTASAQAKRMTERVGALKSLIEETCEDFAGIARASDDLGEMETELDGDVLALDFAELDTRLFNIQATVDTAGENLAKKMHQRSAKPVPLDYLRASAAALAEEANYIAPFLPDDATKLRKDTGEFSDAVEKGLAKNRGKPDQETLLNLFAKIAHFRSALGELRNSVDGEIQQRSLARETLLQRVAVPDPREMPDGFGTAPLAAGRLAVRTTLGEEMSAAIDDDAIDTARGEVESFEADLAAAAKIAESWQACERRFAAVMKDARGPTKAELTRRRQAVLAVGAADFSGMQKRCDSLAAWLADAASEKAKELGAKGTLGGVVVTGAERLDEAGVQAVYDTLGPDAIAACKPEELKTLCACFHKASKADLDALRSLVDEGLGAEGKVFAKLARSGDAAGVLELARGYAGAGNKDDRTRLRALVQEGGLGAAPTVLGDLLGYGVGAAQVGQKDAARMANVTRIKAVGTAFCDADGPARMRTLVADCALGRPRAGDPPQPGVLAELLNGAKAFAGDATALRGFADAYAGTGQADATDRARLKGLIEAGGFGDKPKAFGPLVKAAGAARTKQIGTAFKEPADRGNLKQLLDAGGMSGDASAVGPQRHEYPDTLAKVFSDGLDGDATLLKRFAQSFGDSADHARQCKGMMDSWNEFGALHADRRQPGEQIAKLRNNRGLTVEQLQSTFATNLDRVGAGQQRKLATRFAPNFGGEDTGNNAMLPKPDLTDDPHATDVLAAFILKRHMPRYAVRHGNAAQQLQNLNTYFPVGGDAGELAEIIEEGLTDTPTQLPPNKTLHQVASRALQIETLLGEVDHTIKHCQATAGPAPPDPGEIATFTRNEANAIFDAVRLP